MKVQSVILIALALLLLPAMALAAVPVANFSFTPASGYPPLTVTTTDLSTNTPTDWQWYFGEGTADAVHNSTAKNATHLYQYPGTYTIMLTANNTDGNTTITKTVTVTVLQPLTVTPHPASANNLKTYSVAYATINHNTTIGGTNGGLFNAVVNATTTGYGLLALGAIIFGAMIVMRYLGYW